VDERDVLAAVVEEAFLVPALPEAIVKVRMKRPAPVTARSLCWLISRVTGSWKVQSSRGSGAVYGGREPTVMSSAASPPGLVHLGMDLNRRPLAPTGTLPTRTPLYFSR
jgi:hypothetical protein